jgi:hypothetical protein
MGQSVEEINAAKRQIEEMIEVEVKRLEEKMI